MNRVETEIRKYLKSNKSMVLEYYVNCVVMSESPLVLYLYNRYRARAEDIYVVKYEVFIQLGWYTHIINIINSRIVRSKIRKWVNYENGTCKIKKV